jgi:phage protein D
MTAAIPIYEGQDFYVPRFQVKLQGKPAGADVVRDVLQVTYKDSIDDIDNFEITINNWDAENLTFKYSDQDLFDPGKELELYMGYFGRERLRLMITGEITSLRPTFPASGQPTLVIGGLNLLHRLRKEQVSDTYEQMKDSDIAKQIGKRLGVTVRTNPEAVGKEERYDLVQDNQYDIIFLLQRARRIGYDLFVEEPSGNGGSSQLYFGPSVNVKRVTYRLTYGRSMIQFQPNLDTSNQVGEVTVRGWDPTHKTRIEYTANRRQIVTKGQPRFEKSFKDRKEIIADQPIESLAEAQRLATETLERIAKEMIKGSGSTVGLPDLRAGNVIEIDGLDELFNGRYFVTSTTHTMGDSGYTTSFDARREDL